jgi:hypothetical protein
MVISITPSGHNLLTRKEIWKEYNILLVVCTVFPLMFRFLMNIVFHSTFTAGMDGTCRQTGKTKIQRLTCGGHINTSNLLCVDELFHINQTPGEISHGASAQVGIGICHAGAVVAALCGALIEAPAVDEQEPVRCLHVRQRQEAIPIGATPQHFPSPAPLREHASAPLLSTCRLGARCRCCCSSRTDRSGRIGCTRWVE